MIRKLAKSLPIFLVAVLASGFLDWVFLKWLEDASSDAGISEEE